MKRKLLALVFTFAVTGAAAAQDGYVVGVSAALTGPLAGTYAPVVEGMRVYIDHVNANGGVNGKAVRLVILDNQAQPSKAASDAKRLLTQDKVMLLINASLSSTYAPMVAESKRTGVPLYYAGAVCPNEVNPPQADPLQFCSTGFGALFDSQMGMQFIKDNSKGAARIGFSAMAIPISRGQIDYSEELAKKLGMTPVDKEAIPPPTPDYTPFATKLKDAKPDWVYSWAPWVTQIRTFESLRRLGWSGSYLTYAHIQAEQELQRVKDPKFYVFGTNAFFEDNLPVHAEIRKIAGGAKLSYPVEQLTEGFISGFVLEAALKKTGWPATPKKIAAAMSNLKVDTRGLRGGPIEWTENNHFRTQQYYRVYRWDAGKNAIVREKDWTAVDVK
ncbi:MAG TPA: ABC transporter substrate-binding protein [Burkholderiales bacterium]|jgi:ABC-type branched-subunit amino acid transport system substrate-binding protein